MFKSQFTLAFAVSCDNLISRKRQEKLVWTLSCHLKLATSTHGSSPNCSFGYPLNADKWLSSVNAKDVCDEHLVQSGSANRTNIDRYKSHLPGCQVARYLLPWAETNRQLSFDSTKNKMCVSCCYVALLSMGWWLIILSANCYTYMYFRMFISINGYLHDINLSACNYTSVYIQINTF